MDRLEELAFFVAIVDAGSLSGGARRLRRSAAAATRALASLEARAGSRLIERSTRRLAPTPAGLELAERARDLLAGYAAALTGASEGAVRGPVRVTAPVLFGRRHVAPVVAAFLAAHPEAQIELLLADRNLDLVEEGIDVALRIGRLAESRLVAQRVGQVRLVTVASPAYLAARGVPAAPADLARHDTIVGPIRAEGREWRFGAARVRLAPRLTVNEVEAALVAARAGAGIARVLSYQVADDLAAGRLVRLLAAHEPPPVPVQLVTPGAALRPARVAAFLDHAAAALRKLPAIHTDGPPDVRPDSC
ncbi:LysR substrate-binding domain-containing protein [Methylobacterium sp. NEAU 140]|uniref:LysR substrate-binding domain-containing protein n=1 Tax=Methylobacterium sp. NEAU 140 TaxID=3064945 RepID=UPI002734EDC3|nr:LysR substrate-binding domain-containing protein [Methylobacterium sp. NEAU 140]MDP4023508.1 LysR substrate-binding domain-containing protein [Methylobacterium sp. NEAU 140]